MSKNFNSSMPNYISSFPLTKNKKLVDTEPMRIITGLKPKYMEKKMRKMRKEKLNKKMGAEMFF